MPQKFSRHLLDSNDDKKLFNTGTDHLVKDCSRRSGLIRERSLTNLAPDNLFSDPPGNHCSWIDPDFREQSLAKRFVPTRALIFLESQKTSIPAALVTSLVCL